MASVSSQSTVAARQSIERAGFYLVRDEERGDPRHIENARKGKGRQFADFYNEGYRTKTPEGLDFIVRNTLGDPVIGKVIRSIIPLPRWGYLRLFSDRLSSSYAWFFHIRDAEKEEEAIHTLQVQFWIPGSRVVYYEGSHSKPFKADDPENWGVLRTSISNMEREGIKKREVDLPNGGYTIIDSRLGWTCYRGKFLNIGFGIEDEATKWYKMELPDTESLRLKVAQLEESGFRTNFTFKSTHP